MAFPAKLWGAVLGRLYLPNWNHSSTDGFWIADSGACHPLGLMHAGLLCTTVPPPVGLRGAQRCGLISVDDSEQEGAEP